MFDETICSGAESQQCLEDEAEVEQLDEEITLAGDSGKAEVNTTVGGETVVKDAEPKRHNIHGKFNEGKILNTDHAEIANNI